MTCIETNFRAPHATPSTRDVDFRTDAHHRRADTCDELFRLLPVLTLQIEVAAPEGLPGDPRADLVEERVEEASIRSMDRTVELVSNLPYVACRRRKVVEGALNAPVLRRPQAQGSVPLGISGRCEAEPG